MFYENKKQETTEIDMLVFHKVPGDVGEKFVVKKGNDISSSSVTKNKLPNTPHPKDKKKCSYLNTSGFQSTDNVGNQTKTPVHKKEIVNNKGRSRISLIQNTSKSCRVVTKVKPPARRMRSLIAVKISGDMDPMCGMGVRSPCVDIKAEMPEEIDILRALDLARKTDTPKRRESRRLKNLNKTAEYVFTSKRPTIHSKTSATNTPDNNIPLTPAASSTDKTFHSSTEHVKSKFISSTISASKKGKQNLELNIMPKQTSPDKAAHPIDLNSKRGQSCGSPDLIGVSELMQTPNESLNFSGDDQTMLSPTGSGKSINLKEESTLLDVSTTFQGQNTKSRVTPQEILYTSSVSDVLIDKSQKIIGNSINSQSSRTRNRATPSNYVGVRDLMKTPKNLDESLNLIGVRELMLSPSGSDINGRQEKLVNSLETSKTSPSGVTKSQSTLEFSNNSGTLECSTPKPISPVKFADKKLNSSMEKENMATSSERKKRSGINILIEESAKIIGNSINSQSSRTRNRATPNYVGVRDLMKTPKNLDESLNLSGVRELMLSPSGSDINGHQEKLVNSLETSKTSPSGVTKSQSTLEFSNNTGTLESPTPKPISPVKFADKKLNSSMEKENMATSSERKKRSGINILIEESAKIIGNSINSQSSRTRNRATPSNYVGVRELIKSPKNLDGSLNLSGVKELMLSPSASDKKGGLQKLVNSLETSKTSPSGVTKSQSTLEFSNNSGTLESSTPKPISPVKFADKKLNSSMEKENMATSSERKKRSGINILIEESAKIIGNSINSQSSRTRNRATPNYVGVRDLMKTPKNLDESLNLSGVRELMLSPSGSDINGHQEKLVNSLETSKTSPSGVTKSQSTLEFSNNTGTLESPTPKPISPVKFADKKLNSSMEKENMATSSERKKRSGINILIEESAKIIGNSINSQSSRTRNRATPPNYVVVRQLMKTPKNLTVHSTNSRKQVESPNFIGVRKLLRTPKISPDKSLNLSGIDRLMSSASASDIDLRSAYKRKSDETSRTKRIKKGANINNLQNEGLEVEKTVKKNTKNEHESSPDLAGIRYLMSTPVHTKGLNSPKNVTDINEDSSTSVFKTPVNIGLSSHSAGRKAKGTISPLVKEEFAKRLDTEKKFIANFASKSDLSINFYQNLQKSESPRSEILGLPIEDKSVHNSSLPHVSVLGNSCEMNSELNCSTQLPGNNNIKNVCNWLKNTVNNSLNSTVLDETQEGCRNVEFSLEISSFASPCDKTAEGLNASSFANVSDIQSMSVSPTSRVSSKIDSSVGHTTRSQRTPKMSFNTNDSMLNVSSSESPSKKGQLKTISSPTLDIGSNLKKSPDHVEIIDTSIPNKVLKNCNAISNESSTSIPNTNVISSTEISSSSRRKARKSGVSLATSLGERLTPETCALNAVANVYDAVNTPESPKKSRHSIQKGIVQLAENSTPTSIFNNLCADKRIFSKPHIADYTNVSGIKRLFENAQKSSYLDVQGIKKLFQDEISPTKSDNVGENKSSVLHSNDDGLVCKVSKIQAKKYRKNKTTQETESVSNRRVLRSHQAVNEDELKIDKSIGKTENATPVQKYKRKLVPTSASSNMNSANTEITVGEANTVLEHDSDVLCRSNVPHKSKRGESPVSKSKAETVEHGQSVEKQMKRNRKKKDDSSSCEQSMDNSIRTLRNRSVNKRPHSDLNELEIIPTKAKKVPKTSDGLAASKRKDETSVISEFIPVEKVQVREIRVTRSKGLVTSTPQKGKGVKQSKELKRNIVQSPPSVRSRAKFQDSAPSESGDSSKILPSKKKGLKKQPKKVQFDM
ncbi:hypothetical protein AAG570_009501 [Ranatra chinensis]|uniref:Uncharacterized protein n=1 Tax=Ranatra chinensis TaxID=642074 RepID=A0ABD0YPA0_9HEMI